MMGVLEAPFPVYQYNRVDQDTHEQFSKTWGHTQASLVLVGFSLGGFEALEIARQYPQLIHHVVTIGIGPGYSPIVLSRIRALLNRGAEVYMEGFLKACFNKQDQYERFLSKKLPIHPKDILQETLTYLGQFHLRPEDLQVPFSWTACHGVEDSIMSFSIVEEWVRYASKCVVKLPCGHNPFFDPVSLHILKDLLHKIPLE